MVENEMNSMVVEKHYITLDQFVEMLNDYLGCRELTQYNITEKFDRFDRRTYTLHNLIAVIDEFDVDRLCSFEDLDQVLLSDGTKALNSFMERDLICIDDSWDEHWKAVIRLNCGTITIERI